MAAPIAPLRQRWRLCWSPTAHEVRLAKVLSVRSSPSDGPGEPSQPNPSFQFAYSGKSDMASREPEERREETVWRISLVVDVCIRTQAVRRLCCAGYLDAITQSLIGFRSKHSQESIMITLGIILLIIGFIAKVAILWSLGILLLVIGAVLFLLGSAGRAVGGRRHYY